MKKILLLGAVLTLFIVSASAQGPRDRTRGHRVERGFDRGQITRGEKFRVQKNRQEFKHEKRKALRNGRISSAERRKLQKMKRHDRRDITRFKHNSRRRVM
jgi:hypothetical protein